MGIEIIVAEKLLGILDKEMKEMEARISDKQKKKRRILEKGG